MTGLAINPVDWDYLFRSDKTQYDSAVPFLAACQLVAARSATILDIGCGRGAQAENVAGAIMQDLRGPGRHVLGIDVEPTGEENPLLDEFRLIDSSDRWPVDDATVDLAVSDFTLEHVREPTRFVAELTRVLRPGGAFIARTVSRHSPLAAIARRVPNDRHAGVLSFLQPRRLAQDVFPTCYLMNTRSQLDALLSADFEWSLTYRGGLDQYLLRSPRLSRTVARLEPHFPRAAQTIVIVQARRRLDSAVRRPGHTFATL